MESQFTNRGPGGPNKPPGRDMSKPITARQMKRLLDREARLEAELREVRRRIKLEGREYARQRTGCLWLRPEAIRALVESELRGETKEAA